MTCSPAIPLPDCFFLLAISNRGRTCPCLSFLPGLFRSSRRAWHYSRLGNQDVNETWVADHTCYGHNPDDLQPFHHLFPSGEERKDTVTRAPFRRVASQDPVDSNRHAFHSEHPVGQATVRGGGIDLDGVMYRDRLNVFDSPASIGEGRRKLEKLKQRLAEVSSTFSDCFQQHGLSCSLWASADLGRYWKFAPACRFANFEVEFAADFGNTRQISSLQMFRAQNMAIF